MSKNKYYFVSGNTSKGFINFLATNIDGIKQVIVLQHQSHFVKTKVIQAIIDHYNGDEPLEMICSPFGRNYLEGVILREKSLAIVADTIAEDALKETILIDLNIYYPTHMDQQHVKEIKRAVNEQTKQAYDHLYKGIHIHDELEEIYIKEMSFKKADQLAEKLIIQILENVPKQNRKPKVYGRLFGTNTAEGSINILSEITKHLSTRFFVKGRAGTGKSVLMKKVAKACEDYGYHVERYHCSFDPDSIDMVIVPALDFCIFDSTDPHEFFPEKAGDVILDLYEGTVTQGTDEKYAQEISKVTKQYKGYIHKGINCLKKAKVYQNKLELTQEYMNQHISKFVLQEILREFY